jgi:hypothetical protein
LVEHLAAAGAVLVAGWAPADWERLAPCPIQIGGDVTLGILNNQLLGYWYQATNLLGATFV